MNESSWPDPVGDIRVAIAESRSYRPVPALSWLREVELVPARGSHPPRIRANTVQRCMDVVLERRLQTWFVQEPSRAEEAVRDMARAAGMQHGKTEALIAFMRTQLEVDLTPWQERLLSDLATWTQKGLPSFAGALLPSSAKA